jgi:K+-transporting ATPase ATPase C chain
MSSQSLLGSTVAVLRPAVVALVVLTAVTGVAYPWLTTQVAQLAFPHQANGSLVLRDGKPVGSELIGQQFTSPQYFWGRLSATATVAYNAQASGGSNLGPRNSALADAVAARVDALMKAGGDPKRAIPVDLVTASGSGLDPAISPAAAHYQAARVAGLRKLPLEQVESLIDAQTSQPLTSVFGPPTVNVLALNLALDKLSPASR